MRPELRMTIMAACLAVATSAAFAGDREDLEMVRQTTLNLIQLLVQGGILTQDKADALIQQAKKAAAETTAPLQTGDNKIIRVPYVPEHVRNEIKEELKQEVLAQAKGERWAAPDAVPEWTTRIKLSGDLRLRHQTAYQSKDNAPYIGFQDTNTGNGAQLLNTTDNVSLDRVRLRLGLAANVADNVGAGLRITTGNTNNPVSTNQTLGSTFNRFTLTLDQAYIDYRPLSWLTLTGGRMPNPFFHTDLVWDDDLSFDGVAATLKTKLSDANSGWLNLGAFPVETLDCSLDSQLATCNNNKRLYGVQAGLEHAFADDSRVKVGLAYYDFTNVASKLNLDVADPANRTTLPKFAQKGNTIFNVRTDANAQTAPLLGLAADFRELNLTASADIARFDPIHVVVTGDVVRNIGYDRQKILQRSGGLVDQEPRTTGYAMGVRVGRKQIERFGDWQVAATYKYLQRDAVVDGFTDSDFHLGGTDAKGWILGASYGIAKNAWLSARWLTANEIDGPPLAIDVLQLDLTAKF